MQSQGDKKILSGKRGFEPLTSVVFDMIPALYPTELLAFYRIK